MDGGSLGSQGKITIMKTSSLAETYRKGCKHSVMFQWPSSYNQQVMLLYLRVDFTVLVKAVGWVATPDHNKNKLLSIEIWILVAN